MSNEKVTDWDNPKSNLYDDDIPDVMDDYFRWVDKLKKKAKTLEDSINQYILLEEIKDKEIRRLKADNEALKALIPNRYDERG